MSFAPLLFSLALLVQQEPSAAKSAQPAVPLYNDLGKYEHVISSRVPETRAYFNQGLRLAYGFNHEEAIRAFTEAARQDPNCAICWWGVAYSYGPNINLPMDSAAGAAAWAALEKAQALIMRATPRERDYIRALAERYSAQPTADRARLDSAYARAMQELAQKYPNDPEATVLASEAMMNLRPWNYWQKDGVTPYPGTKELIGNLERVLRANPQHPGACHFYIHAVEASANAAKAVPCAEQLASLMPGAGHLVHMPAHIYIRVGRWNDAIETNKHAVHADQVFIAAEKPQGAYPLAYYPHNHHFLAFAANMAGRSQLAIEHARAVRDAIPVPAAAMFDVLQPLIAYPHQTLVTYGRWQDVLKEPDAPAGLPATAALVAYARGVAHAALGHRDVAKTFVDSLTAAAKVYRAGPNVDPDGIVGHVLDIALHSLMGEIAYRGGDLVQAEQHFREAYKIDQGLTYMEPPHWYYPVQQSLGAVLLDEGNAAEAEKLYREDMRRFPENVWSLKGLALALHAQARHAQAAEVEKRLAAAMKESDITLTRSRF